MTHSIVRWGGIFAGTVITIGCGFLAGLLGNALGLSPMNVFNPTVSNGLRAGSWIYMFLTLASSYYIGGYATTRLSAVEDTAMASMHGFVTWSLATLFVASFGIMVSPVVSNVIRGTGPNAANWLFVSTAFLGSLLSIAGATNGSRMATVPTTTLRGVEGERQRERAA